MRGELEAGVSAAAVPIFDADGDIAAALALVGQSDSLEQVGERRLRSLLERACEDLQTRIAQGTRLPASAAASLPPRTAKRA